ncbi:unnamed protein product [Prunus brigantina]
MEPVSNEAQMHENDDSLPCSETVVPPTIASQNPTPLEPSTGKRKPWKKESDVWEHFEKYDLVLVFGGRKRKTMMEKWKKIQQESENVVITHEVDRYLLDPLESIDEEFDILGWWRINGLKYPTLASIAKDVLAIPTSTIASESCFSTSGRVIDSFRSSLSPRMVEALICSQNWIRSEDISSLQYVPTIEEMEFYESIEMEIGSKTSTTNLNKTLPS